MGGVKKELYRLCLESIVQRIEGIKSELTSIEESRNNETKSSAGDKYETGRAMMQMEEEKSRMQLGKTNQLKLELSEIDPEQKHDKIERGSLVLTNSGKYFISVGIGKMKIKEELYYCISTASPIGKLMRGKQAGDAIEFGGRVIQINNVY